MAKQFMFVAQSLRSLVRAQVAGTVETGKKQSVCQCLGVSIGKGFIRSIRKQSSAPLICKLGERRIIVPCGLKYVVT